MWPMDSLRRTATEAALIRSAALTGGTPPAQGGGWGWKHPTTEAGRLAGTMIEEWSSPEHELDALRPHVYPDRLAWAYGGKLPARHQARWDRYCERLSAGE